jgi:hypothetical protein
MSSDFEQRLRDARDALPLPDEAATARARESALAAVRRRRSLRRPTVAILAAALVGLGLAAGSLIAPSGSAVPAPLGLGFLPERGWSVLQNGGDGTGVRPATAVAANVPLSPQDDPDGLPLSTLRRLPADGVVLVATFVARRAQPWLDPLYPTRALPLDVRDAQPFGVQVRPERPLGQLALRAGVNGHDVDVNVYFGARKPSAALLAAAQRQLDRLVVHPTSGRPDAAPRAAPQAPRSPAAAPETTFDRTFSCKPPYGSFDVVASPHGAIEVIGATFISSGYVRLTWGSGGDVLSDLGAIAHTGHRTSSTSFPAVAYVSSRRCVASRAFVPLAAIGLPGPAVRFSSEDECLVPGRVLVRVRARLAAPSTWRRVGTAFAGVRGRLRQAAIAAREQATGKPLAFAQLDRAGMTTVWTSARCT